MTEDMEKYYSLKEWKKIDIPALREKFLPVVQKAQEVHKANTIGNLWLIPFNITINTYY